MITDIFIKIIEFFNTLYVNFQISQKISDLLSRLNEYQNYLPDFKKYIGGVYFIFGKPLVTYIVGVAVSLFTLRIAIALWKLFKK